MAVLWFLWMLPLLDNLDFGDPRACCVWRQWVADASSVLGLLAFPASPDLFYAQCWHQKHCVPETEAGIGMWPLDTFSCGRRTLWMEPDMGSEQSQSQGSQVLATKGTVISPLSVVILPLKFLSGLKISWAGPWGKDGPTMGGWYVPASRLPLSWAWDREGAVHPLCVVCVCVCFMEIN